jgi:hypothetical protein
MIDPADRIIRINETLSFLIERPRGKSFEELRTERMAQRIEQEKKRDELRATQQTRKDAENQKFIDRWNTDDEIKRLGLDASKLPTDELARARAIRKASWQAVQDTLARQPKFEDTPLGKQAAAERKRIAQREIGNAVPPGTSPEDMEALYYGEIKTQMATAREMDRLTPGQKQAMKDREAEQRIANWEAGQKQKMLDRIGARSQSGADFVAAAGQARAAEQNLRDVIASEKTPEQIRAENLKSRQDLETELRKTVGPSTPGNENFRDGQRVRSGVSERPGNGMNTINNITNLMSAVKSSMGGKSPSTTQGAGQSTGKYEFYNRQTGKVETSDAPGVDRVFRDSSGKAYRIEGGSGRKIYV